MLKTAHLSSGARITFRVDGNGVEKCLAFRLGRDAQKQVRVYDAREDAGIWHFRYTLFGRRGQKLYDGYVRVEDAA